MRHAALALAIAATMTTSATAADVRPDYALTIYSSAQPGQLNVETLQNYGGAVPGYALVRDGREMTLERGTGTIRFTDVAKRIDPTTVSFASLTDPDGTRVIEQNYEFDLVSQTKLLERYIGERISVQQVRGTEVQRVEGRLLSADGGLILALDSGQIVTLANWSDMQFPSLPGGLITRPTLVWLVDAQRAGAHDTRVSYQTQGMTWWSDYNVTLHEKDNRCTMDLSAWVTIVNQSGGSYPQTKLKLVAGEVNRAPVAQPIEQPAMMARLEAVTAPAPAFAESSLFEYHLYTLGRRTDLPDNSTKQLELFPAAVGVDCRKQLVFTASPAPNPYWGGANTNQGYGATGEGTVGAYIEFDNREENRLGMPLPAGRVRVNQASVDGSLEFIGEDLIKHTPRNETLRIKLGNAFDVVGDRKQTAFTYNDAADTIDETFEISVRNRKKVATRVVIREYLYRWSQWDITRKSHDFVKRDQSTIDIPVEIPADGEAKVSYSVRYRW